MLDLLLCIGSIGWAFCIGCIIYASILVLMLLSDIIFDTHYGRRAIREIIELFLD